MKRRFRVRLSLGGQLMLLIAAALTVAMAALGGLAVYQAHDVIMARAARELGRAAQGHERLITVALADAGERIARMAEDRALVAALSAYASRERTERERTERERTEAEKKPFGPSAQVSEAMARLRASALMSTDILSTAVMREEGGRERVLAASDPWWLTEGGMPSALRVTRPRALARATVAGVAERGSLLTVFVAARILDTDKRGEPLGTLVAEIVMPRLREALNDTGILGNTAEVLLGTRDGKVLVFAAKPPLPGKPGAAPAQSFPLLTAAMAGGHGIGTGRDHRGMEVLGAYRYLPSCDWALVVKINLDELRSPVMVLGRWIILAGLALIGVALVFAYVIARPIARRLRILRRGVERIARGNLDHRIDLAVHDEIGELGAAFNNLAAQLFDDIALRQRSEWSLHEREEQYQSLFEHSREAIVIVRPDGEIMSSNRAATALLGTLRSERGRSSLGSFFVEEQHWLALREKMLSQPSVHDFEAQLRGKDDAVIDCLVTAAAQRDAAGRIEALQILVRDITKQKASEKLLSEYNQTLEQRVAERTQELSQTLDWLRTAQAQLVEAEKMAALGGLVAGVAHEINTPIGVGVTAASLLEQKTAELCKRFEGGTMKRSDLAKYLDAASQSSKILLSNLERAAELIRSFKQVAVDQSSEQRRAFAVRGYLQEVLVSLQPKLRRTKVTIDIRGGEGVIIHSYPGAFSQIITNLVMNSLMHAYAPEEEGQICFDIVQHEGAADGALGAERWLVITYADDGAGIPEEHQGKIFDPFFSTKRGQGGSGLGLHIVYNLVTQRLKGSIRCESEVGKGTRFFIEMPLTS